jgi:hypothetical protein
MRGALAFTLAGLALAASAPSAAALQDPAAEKKSKQQADYKAKLDAKLKEAWVGAAGWIPDFDKAKEKAKAEKKLIVAYLTRSFAF